MTKAQQAQGTNPGETGTGKRSVRPLRALALFLLVALAVLLVLLTAVSVILSTSGGSRWVVSELTSRLNAGGENQLEFDSMDGTLLWGLSLDNLTYRMGENTIQISQLRSRWNPYTLLSGNFILSSLEIDQLEVNWHSAPPDEAPADPDADPLGFLPLPVDIQLADALLDQATIRFDDQEYVVDRLGFNALLEGRQLRLGDVDFAAEPVAVVGSAELELQAPYELAATVEWRYDDPDSGLEELIVGYSGATGALNLSGNLDQLQIEHELSAPVALSSQGTLSLGPEQELDFSHSADSLHLPIDGFEVYRLNDLRIDMSGWIDGLAIRVDTGVSGGPLPDITASIAAALGTEQLQISEFTAGTQTGQLSGSGSVNWADTPDVDFHYTLEEQEPGRYLEAMPAEIALRDVSSTGDFSFRQTDTGMQIELAVDSLSAQLNQQALTGNGNLEISGNDLLVSDFGLEVGDNSVSVDGRYPNLPGLASEAGDEEDQNIDLRWQINLPQPGVIYAGMTGSLSGEGALSNTAAEPAIEGQFQARELAFENYSLQSLNLTASTDGDVHQIRLSGEALAMEAESGSQSIDSFTAEAAGPLDNHELMLQLSSSYGDLQFELEGGLATAPEMQWQGRFTGFEVDAIGGSWQLSGTSTLRLSAAEIVLQSHCLAQAQTSLCLDINQSGEEPLQVQADLSAYPLSALNARPTSGSTAQTLPWSLPPDMELDGTLSAQATVSTLLDDLSTLAADFTVETSPGSLTVARPPDSQIDLPVEGVELEERAPSQELHWESARVEGQLRDEQWAITSAAEFNQQNVADTDLAIRGSFTGSAGLDAQQNLSGEFDLTMAELLWIEAFVPQLRETQGELDAHFTLAGTLGAPQVSGELQLANATTDIPVVGIQLNNLNLRLSSDDGNDIALEGAAESGEGTLSFNGTVKDALADSRQLELSVNGNDFRLADIPELSLAISPELSLEAGQKGIGLAGVLRVPLLDVEITSLPESAADVSSDTVLVSQRTGQSDVRNAAQINPGPLGDIPLSAEVRIELGQDVRFAGFGLLAQLDGALDINKAPNAPPLTYGELSIVEGSFETYGRTLTIDHGELLFLGSYDNPALDIRAIRMSEDESITAGVQMNGTLRNIRSQLFSTPALSDGDILAVLVTGKPLSEVGDQDGNALIGAITNLGIERSQSLTNRIQNKLGLDTLAVDSSGDPTDSSLTLGKYITPRLFIRYGVGLFETESSVSMNYEVSENINLEAKSGEDQSIDITYTRER